MPDRSSSYVRVDLSTQFGTECNWQIIVADESPVFELFTGSSEPSSRCVRSEGRNWLFTHCVITRICDQCTTFVMCKLLAKCLAPLILVACASGPKQFVDVGDSSILEPEFQWPVYGAHLTQKFHPNKRKYRRRHLGLDLAGPAGTPIYSIDHGVVVYAGHGFTGYGRLVIVQHIDKAYHSYYAHLSRYKVERGDVVNKGSLVGLMGQSGRATGVHLHFEIRKDNMALNPLDYLPGQAAPAATAVP